MSSILAVAGQPARSRLVLPDLVVKNAAALYVVQIGRKLIPLASAPFLGRVLGPSGWGEVAFVTSLAELIGILIEFGFGLSATRSIARYRDDPVERGRITTGVLCAQALLAAAGAGAAVIASRFIPLLRDHPELLVCGLVYAFAQGFTPLWFFQGMERLRLAAALEIGAKVAALAALIIFVNRPEHVWRALAIQALGPSALVFVGIPLALMTSVPCAPQWSVVKTVLEDGWKMFAFRSAESLYGVANAFLLGLFAAPALVGYFGAAEKTSKAAAGLVNPIRESLYPRISNLVQGNQQEAARLSKVGTGLMIGAGFLFSASLLTFASPLITTLMGGRFEPAVEVLRILSPLPLLLAISFSCGQLWLLPRGKDRAVLRAVTRGAVVNVSLSLILAPRFGHIGMASAVLISISVVAASMLWQAIRQGRGMLHHKSLSTVS